MSALVCWSETTVPSSSSQGDAEAPSSPTAALSEMNNDAMMKDRPSSTSKTTNKKPRPVLRKTVSFEMDVKTHDGLEARSELLDAVIKRYFVNQTQVSELDVIAMADNSLELVLALHEDLQDIMKRVEEALEDGKDSIPVLPRGGGMCTKLATPHIPYVKILDRVVEAAGSRLKRQSDREKKEAMRMSLKDVEAALDDVVVAAEEGEEDAEEKC